MNLGKTVNFLNMFEPLGEMKYKIGWVVVAQLISTFILTLILIYCWPLTICGDSEYPLPWYYPLSWKYWGGGYGRGGSQPQDGI